MRLLSLLFLAAPAFAQVNITQGTNRIDIAIANQPFTTLFYGPEVTKPYLYPLRAPDNTLMSRGWPMDPRAGERQDHIHHRGLWFAHSDVNGTDFWNSDPSYHTANMGRIVVSKIDEAKSGRKTGLVRAQLDWRDPAGKELVHEARTMTFYDADPRLIDFDITLTARTRITFGDDKDGVFGIRLAPELEEVLKDTPPGITRTGNMTGSNGCHQSAECWGSRADWMDVSGTINGATYGLAIFDHPANPRHPTYWHARDYGLLAANIFGVKAFTKNKSADGALVLEPAQTLRFRYRAVIHRGDAKAIDLAKLYHAYALD